MTVHHKAVYRHQHKDSVVLPQKINDRAVPCHLSSSMVDAVNDEIASTDSSSVSLSFYSSTSRGSRPIYLLADAQSTITMGRLSGGGGDDRIGASVCARRGERRGRATTIVLLIMHCRLCEFIRTLF